MNVREAMHAAANQVETNPALLDAERAWREAVAKYNAAQSAAIAAKPDDGAPTGYYDPNDAIHRPVTEAGQECSRTFKVVQELRKSLGLREL